MNCYQQPNQIAYPIGEAIAMEEDEQVPTPLSWAMSHCKTSRDLIVGDADPQQERFMDISSHNRQSSEVAYQKFLDLSSHSQQRSTSAQSQPKNSSKTSR
jgi:hypothetical protein